MEFDWRGLIDIRQPLIATRFRIAEKSREGGKRPCAPIQQRRRALLCPRFQVLVRC